MRLDDATTWGSTLRYWAQEPGGSWREEGKADAVARTRAAGVASAFWLVPARGGPCDDCREPMPVGSIAGYRAAYDGMERLALCGLCMDARGEAGRESKRLKSKGAKRQRKGSTKKGRKRRYTRVSARRAPPSHPR